MEEGIQRVEAHILDHIGIASDIIEELKLVKIIDSIIPKRASHYRITHGQAVKAIILSGLGFQDRRLYSVDRFFKHRPTDVTFGKEITWDFFSDDALGETLDRIFKFGVDKFFAEISSKIILNNKFLYSNLANIDTSSFSLSGKFKDKKSEIKPLRGHSKAKRPDLRQLILSMAITGPAQIPFWMNVNNGNSSDKELLPTMLERIERFKLSMFGGNQKSITIADSALFSKEFLSKFYLSSKWVSRLSESYKIAKDLLAESLTVNEWSKYGQYRYFSRMVSYGNHLLKAIVVHHRKSSYREIATINKNCIKASKNLKKNIKRIQGKVFKNRMAIGKELDKLIESYPYFDFKWEAESNKVNYFFYNIKKKRCAGTRSCGFKAKIKYSLNRNKVISLANKKGKFILVTNIGIDTVMFFLRWRKSNNFVALNILI